MASLTLNREVLRKLVSSWCSREPAINCFGVRSEHRVSAVIRMCSPGLLAGVPFVNTLFTEFGCFVKWNITDGEFVDEEDALVATVTGYHGDLLSCERLALTILSRASGMSTYGRKLVGVLSDISWKGSLRIPASLTPGFEVVEEYSLIIAGLISIKSAACVRSNQVTTAGGIDKVIRAIRSVAASGALIEVECEDPSEALNAANATADVIILNQLPQDMAVLASRLKTSHADIRIQLSGEFDETNLKAYALPDVDLLTTSKLSNGYPLIKFRITYENDMTTEEPDLFECPESESPAAETKPKSPVGVTVDAVVSSLESAPKKARLGDSPKPSGNKQNGTSALSMNQSTPPSISGTNTPREQSHKRSQRTQRPQHNTFQRQSLPRSQATGGLQLMQMASRFITPGTPARAQLSTSQPSFDLNSQLQGVLGQQASPNVGLRIPGQSLPQRMNPGMLGSSPNVNTGFLNLQSQQPQNMPQQNWSMMTGGAAQMMGSAGIGMRMGSPAHMPTCRSCGTANAPGLSFCRNCRNSLR